MKQSQELHKCRQSMAHTVAVPHRLLHNKGKNTSKGKLFNTFVTYRVDRKIPVPGVAVSCRHLPSVALNICKHKAF